MLALGSCANASEVDRIVVGGRSPQRRLRVTRKGRGLSPLGYVQPRNAAKRLTFKARERLLRHAKVATEHAGKGQLISRNLSDFSSFWPLKGRCEGCRGGHPCIDKVIDLGVWSDCDARGPCLDVDMKPRLKLAIFRFKGQAI